MHFVTRIMFIGTLVVAPLAIGACGAEPPAEQDMASDERDADRAVMELEVAKLLELCRAEAPDEAAAAQCRFVEHGAIEQGADATPEDGAAPDADPLACTSYFEIAGDMLWFCGSCWLGWCAGCGAGARRTEFFRMCNTCYGCGSWQDNGWCGGC